jgi:hypothetical protein
MECPFDNPPPDRVFHEDELIVCLWDAFLVSPLSRGLEDLPGGVRRGSQ